MNLKKIMIGDHCIVTSSKRFHLSERVEVGIPFYRSKEIIQKFNGEVVSECDYIPIEEYVNIKQQFGAPRVGDLLLTTRGTYGVPYVYKEKDCFYFADGNITWFKDFDEQLNSKYLYYWFQSYEGYQKVDAIAKGTAQKAVPITTLKQLELYTPTIDLQNKIVDILSTYDNLIENNQKQIKLLEEAAQRLYKEWFVDLRFPGHENVEFVDGVPEGWYIGILGDIGTFKRGKTITKAKIVEGEVPVISGGLGPAYYHNESNTSSPVITVSVSGANAGFTRLYYTKVFASDCSFVDIKQTPYLYWIYLFLKNNSSRLDMLQKGSAQPHVYAKDINALECIIPMKEILNLFCELVSSYFDKIGILDKQIIRLTEARDRLLPKLMSGELEV